MKKKKKKKRVNKLPVLVVCLSNYRDMRERKRIQRGFISQIVQKGNIFCFLNGQGGCVLRISKVNTAITVY
ncbi:MAG: hypothetical protein ABIH91_02550 [Candidatus Omnitrophota bacterium]